MRFYHRLLFIVLLAFPPTNVQAASCALISSTEICHKLFGYKEAPVFIKFGGLVRIPDPELEFCKDGIRKADEKWTLIQTANLLKRSHYLNQWLERDFLTVNNEWKYKEELKEIKQDLSILEPIYAKISAAGCSRWVD